MRKIVILGHSGFIGKHLTEYLQTLHPDKEIIGISLPEYDVTKEAGIKKLADNFDPYTAVVMLAAIKRQMGDSLESYEDSTRLILNICRVLKQNPVNRFIYFSSAAVYGEDIHNTEIDEKTLPHPRSYYGVSKISSECILRKVFTELNESSLVLLRPPTIYGPGDMGGAYGPMGFLQKGMLDEAIFLWGDGSELREFIFVKDIAVIVERLLFNNFEGVLNAASGESHSFKDILTMVGQLLGKELNIIKRERSKEKVDNIFNNGLLRNVIPNFRFVGLEEGLRLCLESQRQEVRV